MNMEMKEYWDQRKVFLFGQLAFLPDDLENKALTKEKLRHYFPTESIVALEAALNGYQQEVYFKFKIITDAGEPKQYIITNSDRDKFHDDLVEYLEEIKAKLPTEQREMLWSVAAKQYGERGYRPVIKWRDIFGNSTRVNYTPPFWEIIFIPATLEQIKLVNISHDNVFPNLRRKNGFEKMPEAMIQFYTRPCAEFEVLDKVLRQRIANPRRTIKRRATVTLRGRKLRLILGTKRYTIWQYGSISSNTYRTAFALYGSLKPLAEDKLNLKPSTKTALKDLLSNAGFRGVVRELFIEVSQDRQHGHEVVKLKRSVSVSEKQYERLLEYVKSKNTKAE